MGGGSEQFSGGVMHYVFATTPPISYSEGAQPFRSSSYWPF